MAQAPNPLSALSEALSTNAGDNYRRVVAPESAFGGETGRALAQAGLGLRQDAEKINETNLAIAGMANETMANDARNSAVLAASKRLIEFKSLEGQNAVAGMDAYQADIQKIFKDTGATLPNPAAQRMFSTVSGRYVANYLQDAVGHSATENKNWQKQSSIATQEIAANTAVQFRGSPVQVAEQADVAAHEAMKQSEVAGEDVKTAIARASIARGKVYSNVINTLAADPQTVPQAQNMLDQVKDRLDAPTVAKLTEHLRPKMLNYKTNDIFSIVTRQKADALPNNTDVETVWAGMKMQESQGHQFDQKTGDVLTSSKGALGVSQILPGTAEETAGKIGVPYDPARLGKDAAYNELLGKAYYLEQFQKYGNHTLSMAAYNAGPGRVDEWLKTIGDPRTGTISNAEWAAKIPFEETRKYVQTISTRIAANNGGAPLAALKDPQKMMTDAVEMTRGDPELQQHVMARVSSYIHEQESMGAQKRSALVNYATDLGVQFLDGNPANAAIPEIDIRTTLPPDKAELLIADLRAKQTAGQVFKGISLATPETVAAMRADLETGQGVFSNMLKGKGTLLRGDTGDLDPKDTQDAADYRTRKGIAALLEQRLATRTAAMDKDIARYTMNEDPMVKALIPGKDATPQQWRDFATSMLASQARLGVREDKQALLTTDAADGMVKQFTHATPDKFDGRAQLVGLQKQFGDQWPKVFGQLVKQGLPSEYRVLGMMDAPGQEGAAAQLQQAFVTEYGIKGGRAALKEGVDHTTRTTIEEQTNQQLAPFRATVGNNVDGQRAYFDVSNAVEALTYSYVGAGKKASEAVKLAVNGVINSHYDVRDGYRIPKYIEGSPVSSDNVVSAAEALQSNLKIEDVGDIGGGTVPGLTADDRRRSLLAGAQANTARWLNNADDTGLVLTFLTTGGRYEPVRLANGARIEFKFSNPPAIARPVQLNTPGFEPDGAH